MIAIIIGTIIIIISLSMVDMRKHTRTFLHIVFVIQFELNYFNDNLTNNFLEYNGDNLI